MPQVYFDTTEFRGKEVKFDPEAVVDGLIKRGAEILRLIDSPWNLPKVHGFNEAARDNFSGWHLHHIGGESIPRKQLLAEGIYYHRPWYELRFIPEAKHKGIHHSSDIREAYYGLQ